MKLAQLEQFALSNHGLVTIGAAQRAGISKATWHRATHDGTVQLIHPGVARIIGSPATTVQAIAAAVLAAGVGALASHRSAAFLWGIPRPQDDPPEIILPVRSRQATLAGVVVHRPRDRKDLSPVLRSSVRCCNILRLLCDLGAVDASAVRAAVGHVLFAGLAGPHALRTAINAHARFGRHGVPAFREALDEWLIDGKPADSLLETAMNALVLAYRLPPVEFHAMIGGHEVDFWIVGTPIVLECDGFATHGQDRAQFERDRVRDAELTALGYITIRFTYRKLTHDKSWVADKIRAALDRWGRPDGAAVWAG